MSIMDNVQPAVKKETGKVAAITGIGLILMWIVFGVLHAFMPQKVPFDYTVFLGGAVGGCVAVLNFFFMGLAVQKAAAATDEDTGHPYVVRVGFACHWRGVNGCDHAQVGDGPAQFGPGGFGDRGIEGMICSIRYAREHKIPYLGLCLGMQLTIVEFARNVLGLKDAHSHEFNENTANPVIHIMPDKEGITDLGGTLRLGSYPCILDEHSKAYQLYGHKQIEERHRHRYEVNNDYREVLQENGMLLSGFSPDGRIVEMVEIPEHPWFIGTQAHPEFKSRPNKPHPLFKGFLAASLAHQNK